MHTTSLYHNLQDAFSRLDKRKSHYRFDIEKDIAWEHIEESGNYLGPKMLARMGIDYEQIRQHPDVFEAFQWACGLEISLAFEALEGYLLDFVDDEGDILGYKLENKQLANSF